MIVLLAEKKFRISLDHNGVKFRFSKGFDMRISIYENTRLSKLFLLRCVHFEDMILDQAMSNHYKSIHGMKDAPGVTPERYADAHRIRHCALSLVGEPIMYPYIQEFLDLLHKKDISTFLVTNAQFPDRLKEIGPVTQLYISIDAATKDSLKVTHNYTPSFQLKDFLVQSRVRFLGPMAENEGKHWDGSYACKMVREVWTILCCTEKAFTVYSSTTTLQKLQTQKMRPSSYAANLLDERWEKILRA